MYKIECSLVIKIEIMSFAGRWMDLQTIMLSVKSDRKRKKIYDITYMWNLKKLYK